jgi:hypothetical protein
MFFCPPGSIIFTKKTPPVSTLSLWQKLAQYFGSFFRSQKTPHGSMENQVKKEDHEEKRDSGFVSNDYMEDEENCSLVSSVSITKTRKRLSFYEKPVIHTTWSKREF